MTTPFLMLATLAITLYGLCPIVAGKLMVWVHRRRTLPKATRPAFLIAGSVAGDVALLGVFATFAKMPLNPVLGSFILALVLLNTASEMARVRYYDVLELAGAVPAMLRSRGALRLTPTRLAHDLVLVAAIVWILAYAAEGIRGAAREGLVVSVGTMTRR